MNEPTKPLDPPISYELSAATPVALFFSSFGRALQLLPALFRLNWAWILSLHVLAFGASQYFLFAEEVLSQRMSEDIGAMALTAGLAMSFNLLWYSAFFALMVRAIRMLPQEQSVPVRETLWQHMNGLLIENLRVLARVIFWLPFLILPAVYQYLRLFLVSFVVVDDDAYEEGRVDALKRSVELTRGHVLLALSALLVGLMAEPLLNWLITGGESPIWRKPLAAIASFPLSMFADVWTVAFIYLIYRGLVRELHRNQN